MESSEKNAWIETHSGIRFNFFNFTPEDILLEDIAWALSHLCRYVGHCSSPCYVAAHSLDVSEWLTVHMLSKPETALAGLLHDGSEAYLNDLPAGLKPLLPEYMKLEDRIQSAIYKKFVGFVPDDGARDEIKYADIAVLTCEARLLIPSKGETWGLPEISRPSHNVGTFCQEHRHEVLNELFLAVFDKLKKDCENVNGSENKGSDD